MAEQNGEVVEMYRRHRPRKLADIIGQDDAVAIVKSLNPIPHAIILGGPTGCGKTSIAGTLKKRLNCVGRGDYQEINAALERGIDKIREIEREVEISPWGGREASRVWLFDEAHRLTPEAQDSLLTIIENPPRHAYFIFCTTNPNKMVRTLRGRCKRIDLKLLSPTALEVIVKRSLEKEGRELGKKVIDKIVEVAAGSAREALVLLEGVLPFKEEKDQLNAVQSQETEAKAFDLARALLWQEKRWKDVAAIITALDEGENWEGIRQLILKCASNELLKQGNHMSRARKILAIFRDNWYDSGRNGLVVSCDEVVNGK